MKQKTKKSVSKKIKVTGSGKLMRRSSGQNHYNSRDTGAQTRAKRIDKGFVVAKEEQNVKNALPYA
ncbi:MAG: 50S ribosomal protein L35 [Candidatus Moranbacteria bacterium]|jgi:large subunit ribosomal protein L35|nr:50S ribosomal protein L35 [Candidatus Moranbacteria bacterium]NTW89862.1 50S ribosomal protein L35 [Candidatus Moranbacteria bacterium]